MTINILLAILAATVAAAIMWAAERRLIAWRARRFVRRAARAFEAGADPPQMEDPANGAIVADDGGFEIRPPRGVLESISWNSVTDISAFKRDMLTTDLICLSIGYESVDGQRHVELNEEMAGWSAFGDEIARRFPLADPHWRANIASPAFATNAISLWIKE